MPATWPGRTGWAPRRGRRWSTTIPAYLCGLYSIVPGANTAACEVIQSVVLEEMLHMALAANVLNAVGGAPSTGPEEAIPTMYELRYQAMALLNMPSPLQPDRTLGPAFQYLVPPAGDSHAPLHEATVMVKE